MTARPTRLAYTLALVIAWALVLAIAAGRAELAMAALPLLVPMVLAARPPGTGAGPGIEIDATSLTEGETLELTISVTVPLGAGPLQILPVLPTILRAEHRPATIALQEASGATVRRSLRLRCAASGVVDAWTIILRVWDAAGLWVAEARHDARVPMVVRPLPTLARLLPGPRRAVVPLGGHVARGLGDGMEFADVRPFVSGDRVRRINWPVSLRRRELHVTRFQAERSAEVVLLIDSFGVVGRRPESSLDHCLRAAAGLAAAWLRQHDRVGLLEFGGWARGLPPGTGVRHYEAICLGLARVQVSPVEFVQDLAGLPPTLLPRDALVLALSPLADDRFLSAVARLGDAGRDVALLALRTDELPGQRLPRAATRPPADRLWRLARADRMAGLRGHGVRVADWSVRLPLDVALRALRPERRA